ncbi:MAG: ATP-dependent DNA helicase RecG [Acholeplasmatales bacterium]|nr:ATP-dependent DNA helicase RecG [Acholeplasmatales bacterium]
MELLDIKGLGKKRIEKLNNEGIYSISDLLLRFPKTYQVYEPRIDNIYVNEVIYLEGMVDSSPSMFKFRGRSYAISFRLLLDNNVKIRCTLYSVLNLAYSLKKGIRVGVLCKYNVNDKYFNVRKVRFTNLGFRIEADYDLDGIPNQFISKTIESIIDYNNNFSETIPLDLIKKYRLYEIKEYIYKSHFPSSTDDLKEVIRRRKYENFFWYYIELNLRGSDRYNHIKIPRSFDYSDVLDFINDLDYKLTSDQLSAVEDIKEDILKRYPMNRLIQGDVGCGKTIVAVIAALMTVKAGFQVAVMAPTEVLANQEYNEFNKFLYKYGINVKLLTSSTPKKERGLIIGKLSQGNIDVLVGTHALIEDSLLFSNLGLVIIDEQHRFGVLQRGKLLEKYDKADSLFLTATPIPRTLGLTMFSELDITSIHTIPSERKEIVTKIIDYKDINKLMISIKNHLSVGEQAYIVVPLIEENDTFDYMDIDMAYSIFSEGLSEYKIGTLHGKMNSNDKNSAMEKFNNHELDVLISTTVIEVGVNVKNATMMIIMDPERFGLSTLHQLRGRVGRGDKKSYCMLVTRDILNPRLRVIEENSDGFKISEEDFNLRGPGEYLGLEQSGNMLNFSSSLEKDLKMLTLVKEDCSIYLPKFLNGSETNSKFDEILALSKNQKAKIN